MKKIFSTLILLIALLSGANAQAPVIEGSSYYLPKTALQFTVLVEKRAFKPGEFAEFADRYLKIGEAALDSKTSYRIVDMKMKAVGVADTSKFFNARISPKLTISKLYISDDGILQSVNTEPMPIPEDRHFVPSKKVKPLNPDRKSVV